MIGPVVSGSGTGDEQDAAIERIRQFAAGNAIAARAQGRGDEERRWLDVQAIIERIPAAAGAPVPAVPDEALAEMTRQRDAWRHDALRAEQRIDTLAEQLADARAAAAVSGQAGLDPEPDEPSCAVCGAASCAGGCCSACTATGGCTHTLPAAPSGRAGEPSDDATGEFLRWLVSMDDPDDKAGLEARRTVTLTAIIDRARAALAVGGDQR